MMYKKILYCVALVLLAVSCGSSADKGDKKEETRATVVGSLSNSDLEAGKAAFIACKNNSKELHACKTNVAEIFAKYYGYHLMSDDRYVPYDQIFGLVSQSTEWEELGFASDQEVLIQAQKNANNGIGTLAISAKGSHSVAVVIKGALSYSNSLGLDCPNVMVLRPKRFNKSFVGKGINYAWSNLGDVKIYSLK